MDSFNALCNLLHVINKLYLIPFTDGYEVKLALYRTKRNSRFYSSLHNAKNIPCLLDRIPEIFTGTEECCTCVAFARKDRYKLLLFHVLRYRKRRLLHEGPRGDAKSERDCFH